jgi:hypothetical protein
VNVFQRIYEQIKNKQDLEYCSDEKKDGKEKESEKKF